MLTDEQRQRQQDAFDNIACERLNQDRKWGTGSAGPPEKWLAVLAEEFGEVARAVLELPKPGDLGRQDGLEQLKVELDQVAAVCVKWQTLGEWV